MKKLILVILNIAFVCCSLFAQSNPNDVKVRVAKYKYDKACAISYTFDDGLMEHYTLVEPMFEKYGFKATFWINGSKINENDDNIIDTTRMSWNQLKKMYTKGHEISNHGWAHKNFSRFSLDEIREDIFKNDSAIYANLGVMPRTFCYPNNNKKKEGVEIAIINRVGTRTEQRSIGSKATPDDLRNWVNTLIETNDWGVGMTHGITYGYDAFKDPTVFWNHLEEVKALEDKIWVGTFEEVAAYAKERDLVSLDIVKNTKRDLIILPNLDLDSRLFTEKLTMVVENISTRKISVKQNGQKLDFKLDDDRLIFDFDPFDGLIQINYK